MPGFVLASASPRRQQLLSEAGLRFEVIAPQTDELASRALTVRELTIGNAARKAMGVARLHPDKTVLGADTLVTLDGVLLGKPANLTAAFSILQRLSGREHTVCTGVCICSLAPRRQLSFSVYSKVLFRTLEPPEIRAYLTKVDPLDKAGAYAAQGHGADIIAKIRGSYTNVVGLPMGETLIALRQFGVEPAPRTRKRRA